jgi:hypothetical protein
MQVCVHDMIQFVRNRSVVDSCDCCADSGCDGRGAGFVMLDILHVLHTELEYTKHQSNHQSCLALHWQASLAYPPPHTKKKKKAEMDGSKYM